MALTREQMAQRIALEIPDNAVVNLGIGIPTLCANYIPEHYNVMLQSENGLLGIGEFPTEDHIDADLINAGKQTVTALPGASYFSSAESFAMIRGGHVDLSILGAMEVDETGAIANWMIPGKLIKGMGGAMDLVAGSQKVIVVMSHCDRKGQSKLLKKCKLPLTGVHCVTHVVTDLCLMDITDQGFVLKELAPSVTVEEVIEKTEAEIDTSQLAGTMKLKV